MPRIVLCIFIFAICLQDSFASGRRLRVQVSDADEPFTATLLSVDGFFMHSLGGLRSQTLQFSSLRPGYYMLDVRFRSGHEYTRTVHVPAKKKGNDTMQISLSRNDAFFAKDLAEAAHGVSVSTLGHEEFVIKAVHRFEQALMDEDLERAEEVLSEVIDEAPRAAIAWNNLGALRLQQNRIQEGLELLRHAYMLDRESFEANLNLARALSMQKAYDEAIIHANEALRIRPGHPNGLALLAGTLFLAGRREEALPYLEDLQKADPDHVCFPELLIASVYQYRGDLVLAAKLVLDFVERYPTHAEAADLEARANRVLAEAASASSAEPVR